MSVENHTKIANFSHPRVFNAPAEGVPRGIVYQRRGLKNLEGRKLFQIGLTVLIQYRRVTDSHPASQLP